MTYFPHENLTAHKTLAESKRTSRFSTVSGIRPRTDANFTDLVSSDGSSLTVRLPVTKINRLRWAKIALYSEIAPRHVR